MTGATLIINAILVFTTCVLHRLRIPRQCPSTVHAHCMILKKSRSVWIKHCKCACNALHFFFFFYPVSFSLQYLARPLVANKWKDFTVLSKSCGINLWWLLVVVKALKTHLSSVDKTCRDCVEKQCTKDRLLAPLNAARNVCHLSIQNDKRNH